MINNWIKIDGDTFYIKSSSVQLTIGSHASIEISVENRKDYSDFFFKKYEMLSKFNLIGKQFEAKGVHIKGIDVDTNQINISLRCDILDDRDISERREEIINEVLNNKDKIE